MKRATIVVVVTTAITTLFLIGLAAAQTGSFAGLGQPILVTIEQAVPVDVTVAIPQADDTVVTATVPLTIGVNLQIKIDGASVVAVEPAADAEPVVVAAEAVVDEQESASDDGQLLDAAGIPYAVQAPDDLVITQVTSKSTFNSTSIVGQIENVGDQTYSFIMLSAPLYDANGVLLDVGGGAASTSELAPGKKTAFTILATVPYGDVASYELQIEGM
ncbi:MAG: FxLYD domain-containing protein [Actinobacteria bacterium]|nr:FxLYD domain-containing protein [Actinomycetota bacterium]HRW50910.1 FxLYD domain-containing protein [Caldilinea sp.]